MPTEQVELIVAGSMEQARFYVKELGLSGRKWLFISSPEYLLGYSDEIVTVHMCGTWYDRKDSVEIQSEATIRKMNIEYHVWYHT